MEFRCTLAVGRGKAYGRSYLVESVPLPTGLAALAVPAVDEVEDPLPLPASGTRFKSYPTVAHPPRVLSEKARE
jgi:hypothetical protein